MQRILALQITQNVAGLIAVCEIEICKTDSFSEGLFLQPSLRVWRLRQTHYRVAAAVAREDHAGDRWARLNDAYLFLSSCLQVKLL